MKKAKNLKPVLFISHVHEDELIAKRIKNWLDEKLAKSINIFVSSDKSDSLKGGSDWWDEIRLMLSQAKCIIVLITKRSLNRNWIYFEIGGGYFQKKKLLPLLINVNKTDIKSPLNQITYLEVDKEEDFKILCADILEIYERQANLFDQQIIKEILNEDRKSLNNKEEVSTFNNYEPFKISDDDALNILESWFGKKSSDYCSSVLYYKTIDKELNFPLGTTKKFIVIAASRYHYIPVRQAEETILFKYTPPPRKRRSNNWVTDY